MKYKLHVIDTTNNKEYDFHFPGSKTILEIKQGLRDVTNIPVRFQRWVGWPDSLTDENTKLGALDLPDSVLELILSKEEVPPKSKKQLIDLTSSESENEFEDAAECFGVDDDMFQASSSSKKIQPLMPEDIEDEVVAVSNFEKEFANRYGPCHPSFQGTLAEALQASCHKPAKERRPLAIYLHHDASVLTNVFCTQLLCSETVVSYLALNFVTWAWDLTYESNKTFLLAVLSQNLGMAAANAVRNIALNNLPAIMVITKVRSTPEVLTVIPGNVGLDDLMTRLIHAVEVFNSAMQSEIWEEEEREAREKVKREQDAAYEASLLADRAKEEARRQEVEEKLKQEEEELLKKEELEQIRQHEEEVRDAIRRSLAEQLPPEPAADSSKPVSHIRVRLPTGITIGRRFTADTPLSLLLTYIASQGYPAADYKVLASWPRRDLTALEEQKTLEELQLYPKETLTLEER
ncbi:FAS-associated factor 1, partial [Stegodyphus mimosarum]